MKFDSVVGLLNKSKILNKKITHNYFWQDQWLPPSKKRTA